MAKNQTIQHKRSSVAGNKPTTTQLAIGELAINFADRSLYTSDGTNIVELERDVIRSATQPLATTGTLWWNSTTEVYQQYDGTKWTKVEYAGAPVLPANTTASVALSGSGTSASPYAFAVSTVPGASITVGTFTISGLNTGQLVPIIDTNAVTNGGRFRVTNRIVDDNGILRFSIVFSDHPSTVGSANYIANFVVGTGTVYINTTAAITATFPQAVNFPSNTGIAETTWSVSDTTLTPSGSILMALSAAGPFNTTARSVTTGVKIWTKWSGDPGSGIGIDSAHGTTISGTITATNGGTTSSSLVVDKVPAAFAFPDITGAGLSIVTPSQTATINGINSYVYPTSTTPGTGQIAIDSGTWTAITTTAQSTLYAISGSNVTVRVTSSATNNTAVNLPVTMGTVSDTFTVTTGTNIVNTPTITSPANNSTGISASLTITSSAYAITGIIGTHLNSDWEIHSNSSMTALVTSSMASTTNLTSWTPTGLGYSTAYWVRVRYRPSTGAVSDWSPSVKFTVTSEPGTLWTNRADTLYSLRDVAWSGSMFVACGHNGSVYSSTDGTTWITRSSGLGTGPGTLFSVATDGINWVAVGEYQRIIMSSDGTTWQVIRNIGTSPNYHNVTWNGSIWLMVGDGTIQTSPNGIDWTSRSVGTANGLYKSAWNGSRWIVVGLGGVILTSTDSINWSLLSSGTTDNLEDVQWNGTEWVIVGGNSFVTPRREVIITSTNGINWTVRVSGGTNERNLTSVTWDGSRWIATAAPVSSFSPITDSSDGGLSWTSRSVTSFHSERDIAVGNNMRISVGRNGSIITSGDGTTWTIRASGTSAHLQKILWNGARWITVGINGTNGIILSSP